MENIWRVLLNTRKLNSIYRLLERRIFMFEHYSDVWNVNELCLALKISKKTAYYLLSHGDIPYRKVGRHYKLRKMDVINYIANTNDKQVTL